MADDFDFGMAADDGRWVSGESFEAFCRATEDGADLDALAAEGVIKIGPAPPYAVSMREMVFEAEHPLLPGEDKAARLRRLRGEHGPDSAEAQMAFRARAAELAREEEEAGEPALWMLSFCDPDVPPADPPVPGGPSWLGACVVEARGPWLAVQEAWARGCNPGGEAQTAGPLPLDAIGPEWRNRLLTKDEVEAIPEPEGWPG